MENSAVFGTRWQPRPLLLSHAAALLIFLTLLPGPGRDLWRTVDDPVYFAFNQSLGENHAWAGFMAWANTRWKDLVTAVFMLLFFVFPGWGFQKVQLQRALVGFLALMIFLLPFRFLVYESSKILDITGPSPSRVHEDPYLVTAMFPEIPTKDGEGRSFPGDHATVMLVWLGYILANDRRNARKWRVRIAAGLVTLIFLAPRVIVGSHWLSDLIVGGFAISLPVLAWSWYSPLPHALCDRLCRFFFPIFDTVGKWPLIGKLPFFNSRD